MINSFIDTHDYKIGDLALIIPDLKLYTFHVTPAGSVQQQHLILDADDFIVGMIYDILTDDQIPYCQIKFLIGNEIFYFDSHETHIPNLKIIN